jgi:hypothetical protein
MNSWIVVGVLAVAMTACGGGDAARPPVVAPPPAIAALMLAAEPPNALGVAAAKQAGPVDRVAVAGRIAKVESGFAMMTLMDLAIPYCGETNKEDDCKTPWDYCCESSDTRTKNALLVEVRDTAGKPIVTSSLGDLRLLDQVTVTGRLQRDEHGNLVLLAAGWFKKGRPNLPDYVRWPQ